MYVQAASTPLLGRNVALEKRDDVEGILQTRAQEKHSALQGLQRAEHRVGTWRTRNGSRGFMHIHQAK